MTGTTSLIAWPYPTADDLIAEGAEAIEGLAEGIEAQFYLANNRFTPDDPWSGYPSGMSIMRVTSGAWAGGATAGHVVTYRGIGSNSNYVHQWFYRYSSGGTAVATSVRQGFVLNSVNTWTAWLPTSGPSVPAAQAAGTITMAMPNTNPSQGAITATVSFPSGRFTAAPRVWLTYKTSLPKQVSVALGGSSTTSVTIYYYRGGDDGVPITTNTDVHWLAVQGAE